MSDAAITDDPHRAELHASGFRALVEVGERTLGAAVVEEILGSLGIGVAELDDPQGWFSLHFAESFMQALADRAGVAILDEAIKLAVSPRYLGIVYPLFRSFGTPGFLYKQATRLAPRVNKVTDWQVVESGAQHAVIAVSRVHGAPSEQTPLFCRVRTVQLAELATLFDLPAARVEHKRCMLRGDAACVYEVRWTEHRRRVWSWVGLLLGLGGAWVASLVLASGSLAAAVLAALLGIGGWAVGRTVELRRDVTARVGELGTLHEALTRATEANEQRFVEVLEAKTQVERKVDERTAELREATVQLTEALDRLRELDRAKTEFFNNVSHELRSPLTLIVAPLEDLAEGRTPPGGSQAALDSMRRNARRLLQLINQLLDLAKIDAGEARVAPVPTDLGALVRGVFAGFEAAAARKGVTLQLACPASMPSVAVDASWIESAITNLVANALRVTERGGVRVSVEDRGADVTIAVSDDGPGIALEDQVRIFERFAQGDVGKRVVGGTGIGLSLVREAARLHQGSVELSSVPGEGATFVLTLPRRAPAESARPAAQPSAVASEAARLVEEVDAAGANTDRDGPSPDAPLIVIAEDNVELRRFMADVLGARFRVRSAVDGREALRLVRELRPDVVVSDVAMPEMDGYALCRALRAEDETRSVAVVLVTARTEIASVLEGFDAGASDYVLKPFHGRELLARVEVHVRLRRMLQQLALRERHAMLGVMAASVAHQVRNPLTALVSGLPAMRSRMKSQADERTLELLDVMIDCAGRIEHMTGDLMNLSRVDRETESAYRPSDGLRSALRLSRARGDASGVAFEEQIEEAPLISGRPGDMSHVFLNLLDNAIRAAGAGGTVRVEAAVSGEQYMVRVGDSGPGVDPAHVKSIFDPFFTTRAAGQGTGLGLGVVLQVLDACGGGIEVGRSELGGALFSVRIPLRQGNSG